MAYFGLFACIPLVRVASKMLYETIAVSLFARPPMPALLAVRGFTVSLCSQSRSQSRSYPYMSHGFSSKRKTDCLLPRYKEILGGKFKIAQDCLAHMQITMQTRKLDREMPSVVFWMQLN